MKLSALHLGLVLVLVSGTIAYATLSTDRGADNPRAALAAGKSSPHLKAAGKVKGLYPGAVKNMSIRIHNGYAHPVKLGYVKTKARDASPGCTKANIAVKPKKKNTHMRIPARGTRDTKIKVEMLPSAVDACQGAKFPLRFRVKGKVL